MPSTVITPSGVDLAQLTSDPSAQDGFTWYRSDLKEYRMWVAGFGDILSTFPSPCGAANPMGVDVDSNDCIWSVGYYSYNPMKKMNQQGSILSNFSLPCEWNTGVGVDPNDSVWSASNKTGKIYQFNQTGSLVSMFSAPSSQPQGIAFDEEGFLWHADVWNRIYQMTTNGLVVGSFYTPHHPRGLGIDSNDCIWYSDSSDLKIYQTNKDGSVVSSFATPSDSPKGIGFDSGDNLWHADVYAERFYKIYSKPDEIKKFNLLPR